MQPALPSRQEGLDWDHSQKHPPALPPASPKDWTPLGWLWPQAQTLAHSTVSNLAVTRPVPA